MKKGFKYYIAAWAILVVLFNVIAFVTPSKIAGEPKFTGSFWAGYAFTLVAFAGQLLCAHIALKQENETKMIYHMPLATISFTGLIVTVIAAGICMFVPGIPYWVTVIVCAVVLAFTAIGVLKAQAAADIVESKDAELKAQTFFIKGITSDAAGLQSRAATDALRAECKKVYEALRYSDPMSSERLSSIESQIAAAFNAFAGAVDGEDETAAAETVKRLLDLIEDRNRRCRLMK